MHRRMFLASGAALIASGVAKEALAANAPGPQAADLGAAVDGIATTQIAQQYIPGAAVAVVKAGQVVKAGAYGLASLELGAPVAIDTVFRPQSLSKPFTAMAIMMLVEGGRVRIEDPVSAHLKDCPASWAGIRISHLLSHTSGLADFINEAGIDLRREATDEALMASVASRPLKSPPGQAYGYCDTNYLLLGMILQQTTGQWYGDFLAERIFKPLDMTRTSVPRDHDIIPGRASGYFIENARMQSESFLAWTVRSYAGGGIYSSVLDLAKWDAALYTDRLLKRETLEQMWTPVKLNNGRPGNFGLGWEVKQSLGRRCVWHNGNWIGFSCDMERFVDDQLTVIVLSNRAEANIPLINTAIAQAYLASGAAAG
ncbi:MAG: penicillin-binding protein [Caulobacteraceae bacterium]|nr:penicillin-binding protein [Caulobacteraceae bacterium]